MKSLGLLMLLVIIGSFSSAAQIATTMRRLDDGSTEITLKNNSPLTIEAFAISATLAGKNGMVRNPNGGPSFVAYYDPAIDSSTRLLPNQEQILPPVRIMCGPVVKQSGSDALRDAERAHKDRLYRRSLICALEELVVASVFGDGSTSGDAALLTRLLFRRSNMLLAIDTTIETLSRAGRHNPSREQLIDTFKNLADSLNRWYLSDEQQIGRRLYQAEVAKLLSLPKAELGSPFPPSDFVRRETAMLAEQRIALVQSPPSLEAVRTSGYRRPSEPN